LSIKDILFHLDVSKAAQPVNEFAISLAATMGAHLTAAALVIDFPPVATDMGVFATTYDFSGAEMFAQIVADRRKAANEAYERLIETAAFRPGRVIIEAFPEVAYDEFARLARGFDLSILPQEKLEDGQDDRMLISAALFASGRPVLLVPSSHRGAAKLEKALVCWDGGAQAAKALAESLPLLAQARNVEVLRFGAEAQPAEPDIIRHLSRHGITAIMRELSATEDRGSAILAHAAEIAADYLVMGAYGHWRLREFIFGGTTRTVLAGMKLPVLMAH
jgi:nucleotide-binding universal stress UspA family protein